MGLLQKVWPFKEIERLTRIAAQAREETQLHVVALVKQGNELSQSRADNRSYLKSLGETDSHNRTLRETVESLRTENKTLKAKLTRKGIKHKKVEPIKNRPF